jgi:hypothetical protein
MILVCVFLDVLWRELERPTSLEGVFGLTHILTHTHHHSEAIMVTLTSDYFAVDMSLFVIL